MEKVYNTKCKYLNLFRYCDHKQIDKQSIKIFCSKKICPLRRVTIKFEKVIKNSKHL